MRRGLVIPVANSILCMIIILICLSIFLTRGLGVYAARATGTSMLPTIPRDALLILEERQPRVGDIVHVKNHAYNYAHRLVAIRGRTIFTKGDNCDQEEVASIDDVAGVVIFHTSFSSFLLLSLLVIGLEVVLAGLFAFRVFRDLWRRDYLSPTA